MSYATIEAQVQTLIRGLDDYADADVTRGDHRVLDSGGAPYAVLRPGPFTNEFKTPTRRQRTWTVLIEVYEKHVGDGSESTNLSGRRQNLVELFDKYPTLNSLSADVTGAYITGGDDPFSLYDEDGGGPYFLAQVLRLEVKEQHTVTGGEYA